MADLGTVGTPTFEAVGDRYLRVAWTYTPATPTDNLEGFKLWWGESPPADWGAAIDMGLLPYSGTSPRTYGVLLDMEAGTAMPGETFEEYGLGSGGTLDKGGMCWGGAWIVQDVNIESRDDFEGYALGSGGTLDGGTGWAGAWQIL